MISMDYFRAIHGALGCKNAKEVKIANAKQRLKTDMLGSVNCVHDSLRNGVPQKFLITPEPDAASAGVIAFPDERLDTGDIIDALGEKWLVSETFAMDDIHPKGKMLRCNLLFKWKNFDGKDVCQWGVLDSGIYSTNEAYTDVMTIPDRQFKAFLPYNDDTKTIYEGRRFAVQEIFNEKGEKELACFRVTSMDSVSGSFGGGLLILRLRSDVFKRDSDSMEHGMCDYSGALAAGDAKGGWLDE